MIRFRTTARNGVRRIVRFVRQCTLCCIGLQQSGVTRTPPASLPGSSSSSATLPVVVPGTISVSTTQLVLEMRLSPPSPSLHHSSTHLLRSDVVLCHNTGTGSGDNQSTNEIYISSSLSSYMLGTSLVEIFQYSSTLAGIYAEANSRQLVFLNCQEHSEDSGLGKQIESLNSVATKVSSSSCLLRSYSSQLMSVDEFPVAVRDTESLLIKGQRSETLPFAVTLQQHVSGIGLILGTNSTGMVCIRYMVSFGSSAKDGTLRVRDVLLEINGVLVVGKSVEVVRSLLRWIPRRETVTIVAMAPPRNLSATTQASKKACLFSAKKCILPLPITFPPTSTPITKSSCDDVNMSAGNSDLNIQDSGFSYHGSEFVSVSPSGEDSNMFLGNSDLLLQDSGFFYQVSAESPSSESIDMSPPSHYPQNNSQEIFPKSVLLSSPEVCNACDLTDTCSNATSQNPPAVVPTTFPRASTPIMKSCSGDDVNISDNGDLHTEDSGIDQQASAESQSSEFINMPSSLYCPQGEDGNSRLLTAPNSQVTVPPSYLQPHTACVTTDRSTASQALLAVGRRSESLPFMVTLRQQVSGIGLTLGTSVSGLVYISYMVSTGSAALDGTLKVRDELLEVNGLLVVGKTVEEVCRLLLWIPRRETVTIVAMAPPRDVTTILQKSPAASAANSSSEKEPVSPLPISLPQSTTSITSFSQPESWEIAEDVKKTSHCMLLNKDSGLGLDGSYSRDECLNAALHCSVSHFSYTSTLMAKGIQFDVKNGGFDGSDLLNKDSGFCKHVKTEIDSEVFPSQSSCNCCCDEKACTKTMTSQELLIKGQRSEALPFGVTLLQRVSGIGLILGTSSTGMVCIRYMVSFGSAAKDGTLKVKDELLEINGELVVGWSVEKVRSLLRWIPRSETVTIIAMAPPRHISAPMS